MGWEFSWRECLARIIQVPLRAIRNIQYHRNAELDSQLWLRLNLTLAHLRRRQAMTTVSNLIAVYGNAVPSLMP